ncbi:MAG TPA: MmcQ/YjbR family DNA-binding protein [Candidatus Udaeobacter sp.]|jgi:hypothetical protein
MNLLDEFWRRMSSCLRMTPNDFRKLALNFPEAVESAHMRHPDFRVGGRIFATLGYPDEDWAMVKLPGDAQKEFVCRFPGVFKSAKGAWGRHGSTNIYLLGAKVGIVRKALTAAWHNTAPKRLLTSR